MPKRNTKPIIAVTTGDPAGIGPEIVEKLFAKWRPRRSRPVIIGAPAVFRSWLGRTPAIPVVDDPAAISAARAPVFLDTGCRDRYPRGKSSRGAGGHAGRAIELACGMARAGTIQGIVTAPISKRSLNLAGYEFAGHTEMLARKLGAPDCQMMMVYGGFRVVPLTRHLPLRAVARALSRGLIVTGLSVINEALKRQFRVARPHIAVAGLNPHAGEGGLLGQEEVDIIEPAIRLARRKGMRITGPVPADALFQSPPSGTFDAFVSMYHDQGLIPFKMLAKRRGVNVTVGLPVIRTSVDHGVAYDIAGRGIASEVSLRAAYRLAERLVVAQPAAPLLRPRGRGSL